MRSLVIASLALFMSPIRADDKSAVKELLDKAMKAHGGAGNAAKLGEISFKGKAKVSEGGMEAEFSVDASMSQLDRTRMLLTINANGQNNMATLVLNGAKIWARDSRRDKTEEAPAEVAPMIQSILLAMRAAATPASLAGRKDLQLTHGGKAKVGDADADLLRISRKDLPDITLYYDIQTGLPLKSEAQLKEANQATEMQYAFHFSEFKEVDGVKHFGHVKITRDGKDLVEIELSEFSKSARNSRRTPSTSHKQFVVPV
jgi:hypothetical protein